MSYALVTGAAKGIGKAIAEELARRNYNLLLVDIDEAGVFATAATLQLKYGISAQALPVDLSEADAVERIKGWTHPYHNELTVVVNNAGYGLNGAFTQLTLQEQLNSIDVNIKAQVSLSYTYLPVLKKQQSGYLLNVSSTTAFQSVPYLTIYAAAKVFVLSFTRSLRYELRHSPVSVSVLIPGSTDTDFVNRARMGASIKQTAGKFNMTPARVAQIAVKGLFNKKAEIIPGFVNKLHGFFPRFFPKRFTEKIGARIYEPKEDIQQPVDIQRVHNSTAPVS